MHCDLHNHILIFIILLRTVNEPSYRGGRPIRAWHANIPYYFLIITLFSERSRACVIIGLVNEIIRISYSGKYKVCILKLNVLTKKIAKSVRFRTLTSISYFLNIKIEERGDG